MRYLSFLQRWIIVALIAGCAPATVKSRSVSAPQGNYHVVKPGETLYRIAKSYDLAYEDLAGANDLRDPHRIFVGQKLRSPGREQPLRQTDTAVGSRPPEPAEPAADGGNVFLWPVSGSLNSGFGPRGSGFHDGVDISAPEGTPIRAVEQGEVIYSDQLRGYGNMVIIRHSGGIVSVYAHNQLNLVREGQQVGRGEIIGRVGSTGRVTGPHLHFEIRKNNLAQDPLLYLPQLCCVQASDMLTPEG